MGKATIISGGTDGLYQIDYKADRTRMQAKIDRIVEIITIMEEIDIPRLADIYTVKEQAAEDKLAELNAAIYAGDDTTVLTDEYNAALAELTIAKRNLDTKKAKLASLKQEKKFLTDNLPPPEQIPAWCADLNESLSGEVGTIEVPGERTAEVIIKPGGVDGDQAVYNAAVDGQIVPCLGISATENFYNLAMLPGWQKHQPTYRLGTVTALNGDLCDITLDPAISSRQDLDVNPAATLTDVPITYLDCHGGAFEVGNRVVVKYTGSGPGTTYTPGVIGFESNPKDCCAVDFTADVVAGSAPLTVNFTGQGVYNKWLWDFGESEYGGGQYGGEFGNLADSTTRHIYYNAGIFNVLLKSWNQAFGEEAYIAETSTSSLLKDSDPDVKYSSNAAAYASFSSRPWVSTTYQSPYYTISRQNDGVSMGVDRYFYGAVKTTVTVRLSTVPNKSIRYMKGEFRFTSPSNLSDSVESLPIVKNGANIIAQKDPRLGGGFKTVMADLTEFGLADTIIEVLDGNNYVALSDPIKATGSGAISRKGWRWRMTPNLSGGRQSFKYSQYTCLATKQRTDYITVT